MLPEVIAALGGTEPTPQQWTAITHPAAPAAVIAGAGSGKTAVMAARCVYLAMAAAGRVDGVAAGDGAAAGSILCLTFTNAAAAELADRVATAMSTLALPEAEHPVVLTYHSFAASLLDEHGLRLGIAPGATLLSPALRWQLGVSLLSERSFEHLETRTITTPVQQMLELADQCANHLVDPMALAATSRAFAAHDQVRKEAERSVALKRAELAELVSAYQDAKRRIGAIDYGDQIRLAVQLAAMPEVVRAFRERFHAVLLDEYQDTNHAQAVMMRSLLGRDYPVMSVGDPDQNIYAWRGASLRNILEFSSDFGGVQLPLYVNFRSGARILAVADAIIAGVPPERRPPGKRLEPHPSRGDGAVECFVAADENAEGAQIAATVRQERDAGTPLREIAVLCRKKRLMEPVRRALVDAGIPVEVVDLGGLLQIPEIVDVVAWLRILDDPSRNIALARILQGPRFRIGYRDMVALSRWTRRSNADLREALGLSEYPAEVAFPLFEALGHLDEIELSAGARERLEELIALHATLRAACAKPLDQLVSAIVDETGLMAELEWRDATLNVLSFTAAVAEFAPVDGDATLATLVSYLDAIEDADSEELEQMQPSGAESVKIMTIHKAKGLEWDVVFVPGLATQPRSKLFPDTARQPNPLDHWKWLPFEMRGDAASLPSFAGNLRAFKEALRERAMEEERRLAYVALTRARKRVIASAAWWYTGPAEPFEPSEFYAEIAGHDASTELFVTPKPERSPLVERRAAMVPSWPLKAREIDDLDEVLAGAHAGGITTEAPEGRPVPGQPLILPVSAIVEYMRCPRSYYDTYVEPVPRAPSAAARLGDEIHRWIEERSAGDARGDVAFEDALYAPTDAGDRDDDAGGSDAGVLRKNWLASRFAATTPLHVELPFLLYLEGRVVSGRIDAVFEAPGGVWEIVDYKTGSTDPSEYLVQMALYRMACEQIWNRDGVRTIVVSLATGAEHELDTTNVEIVLPPTIASRADADCRCGRCF